MSKVKKSKKEIEELCSDESEVCFKDNPEIKGTPIASFSFDEDNNKSIKEASPKVTSSDTGTLQSKTYKRSYMLSASAIRKVDELKFIDSSLTTYVSKIVENAINYYYDTIINKKNPQK